VIVNANSRKGFDGLRFAAQMRADETTRHLPILASIDPNDRARLVKALEIGVQRRPARPIDPEELIARVKSPDQGQALHRLPAQSPRPFAGAGGHRSS
jgi:two-component system cell cycle response regulator